MTLAPFLSLLLPDMSKRRLTTSILEITKGLSTITQGIILQGETVSPTRRESTLQQ